MQMSSMPGGRGRRNGLAALMKTSVEEVVVEGFAVKDPGALPTTPAFPRRCTAAANATECSVSVRDELASLPTPPSSELAGAEVAASVEEEPALPVLAAGVMVVAASGSKKAQRGSLVNFNSKKQRWRVAWENGTHSQYKASHLVSQVRRDPRAPCK